MTYFEIDLAPEQAARFDRTFDAFVEAELLLRPDIDVHISRYSKEPQVERRAVFISSEAHVSALLQQLQATIADA